MPPKTPALSRKASKRKVDTDDEPDASESDYEESGGSQKKRPLKKQKSQSGSSVLAKRSTEMGDEMVDSQSQSQSQRTGGTSSKQPTNTKLPETITLPPPTAGAIKIVTWNVAGLAASQKKGFRQYVEAEDPDILILNETKVNNIPVDPFLDARYAHRYWNIAEKKGYAGTAIFSKIEPLSVSYAFPEISTGIVKGRYVLLEFQTCWLIGTYVPNAGANLKSMDAKVEWQTTFEKHLRTLDSTKPLVWGGDINVAATAKDLKNDKSNWNKTAGYTQIECNAFARMLNPTVPPSSSAESSEKGSPGKLLDIWRDLHPKDEHYTYFSHRFSARTKGMGWRLDSFIISERISSRIKSCEIRSEIWGASDHCPLAIEIDGPL